MSLYVTDTHPLVWYASGKHGKLPKKVLRTFQAASRSEALIHVPVFVLWEIGLLSKIGKIVLRESYPDWALHLTLQPALELAPVDIQVMAEAYRYPFPDPFDGVITATAKVMDLPLMTKDSEIHESRLVEIHW